MTARQGLHVRRRAQILSNQIQQEALLTGIYKPYTGIQSDMTSL